MIRITNFLIKPILLVLISIAIISGFALQNMAMPELDSSLILFLFAGVSIFLYIIIHMLLMKIVELNNE